MLYRRTLLTASASLLAAPAILRAQTVQKLTFYYPDRGRRSAGRDHGWLLQGVPEGDRRRGRSGVCRRLQPDPDQGRHRDQRRRRPAIRRAAGSGNAQPAGPGHPGVARRDRPGCRRRKPGWTASIRRSWPTAMPTGRPGRCRSSARPRCSITTRPRSRRPVWTPRISPPPGPRSPRRRRNSCKRDASGKVTRWGIKMAGDLGNAQWTFGALANQAEQSPDERGGHRGLFQSAEDDRGDGVLAQPVGEHTTPRRTACRTGRNCRPISCKATRRSSSTPRAI